MNQQYDYGNCRFCGAKMIMSQRTGKPYCSDKCWDKGGTKFVKQGGELKVRTEPNWEEIRKNKEDNIAWLNARNLATQILIAAYQKGEIAEYGIIIGKLEETTKIIYEEITKQ